MNKLFAFLLGFLRSFLLDTKARVVDGVVDIMVVLIIIGSMGGAAFNFGAANFSLADAPVRVMIGTVVPIMAGVAILLLLISNRRKG